MGDFLGISILKIVTSKELWKLKIVQSYSNRVCMLKQTIF